MSSTSTPRWLLLLAASACANPSPPRAHDSAAQPAHVAGGRDGAATSAENVPTLPAADSGPTDSAARMNITAGSKVFTLTLVDNETTRAFTAMLPLTVNMSELNSNEKYYDLPRDLPADASKPGKIEAGDVMLYGSNTLVLFYKSFSTSNSYTRIGKVDDATGLAAALGSRGVTVTFAF